jgi:hypothetical protein
MHKFTLEKHPETGKTFVYKTNAVVCSRGCGMALAYSLDETHVVGHCQRVGATAGMSMKPPFILMLMPKDEELRSVVPRADVAGRGGGGGGGGGLARGSL